MENNIEKQLTPVVAEIATIQTEATAIEIKDEATNAQAIEYIGGLTAKKKQMESLRKSFVAPLNKHVKDINSMFKPQAELVDSVIQEVKGKMATYHTEQEKKRAAEESKKQKIRDAANAKRAEKGIEEIAEPVNTVAEVEITKQTATTQATVKVVWKHEIVSINKLPDDVKKAIFEEAYKKGIIDTVVRKFVNAGVREMTGVKIYEDKQISVKV